MSDAIADVDNRDGLRGRVAAGAMGAPMARRVLLAAAFVLFALVALLGSTIGLLRSTRP
jgi:hypothetical protein